MSTGRTAPPWRCQRASGLPDLTGALRHLHRGYSPGSRKPGRGQPGNLLCQRHRLGGEGTDLADVISKLERYADATLRWADSNVVRFETPKTEAILFSRQRKHQRCGRGVRVEEQMVHFASEASRWLGIWLDPTLVLVENRGRRIGRMCQAEAKL